MFEETFLEADELTEEEGLELDLEEVGLLTLELEEADEEGNDDDDDDDTELDVPNVPLLDVVAVRLNFDLSIAASEYLIFWLAQNA